MSETIQVQVERKYMTNAEADQVRRLLRDSPKLGRQILKIPLLAQALAEMPKVGKLRLCGPSCMRLVSRALCVVRGVPDGAVWIE